MVPYRYALLSLHSKGSTERFRVHLCDLFTPDFVNFAVFFMGKLSISLNAVEAFYLPAASAEAVTPFVIILVVVMTLTMLSTQMFQNKENCCRCGNAFSLATN